MYHKTQKNASLQHIMKFVRQKTKHKVQRTIISILFTCLFIFSFSAKADWSTDITNNTPIFPGKNVSPLWDLESDGGGGAWAAAGDGSKLLLQHFDSNGNILNSNGMPATVDTEAILDCRILDATTNWVAVVYIYFPINDSQKIYVQKINKNGEFLWGANGVQVTSLYIQQNSLKTVKTPTGYAIAFLNINNLGQLVLYAQKIDFNGNPQWSENGIRISADDRWSNYLTDRSIHLLSVDTTNIVFVWGAFGYAEESYTIRAQKVAADGSFLWQLPYLEIDTTYREYNHEKFLFNAKKVFGDQTLVCWYRYDGSFANYYLQLLDKEGTFLYPSNGLNVAKHPNNTMLGGYADSCLYDSDKKVMLSWCGYTNSEKNVAAVYYRPFDLITTNSSGPETGNILVTSTNSYKNLFCFNNPVNDYPAFIIDDNYYLKLNLMETPSEPVSEQQGSEFATFTYLSDNEILIGWDRAISSHVQPMSLEIPEPVGIFIFLFIIFLFKKTNKKTVVFSILIISTLTFARSGGHILNTDTNNWQTRTPDNAKKCAIHYKNKSNSSYDYRYKVFGLFNKNASVEGGEVDDNYDFIGLYALDHDNSSVKSWIELKNDTKIEFGGSEIDFNQIKLLDVRTPLFSEIDHAANVQFVLDCMNGATNGSAAQSWCLSKFYPREDVDAMTNSLTQRIDNGTNEIQNFINTNIIGIQNNKNEIISVSNYLYYVVSPRTTNNAEKIADNLHFTDLNEQAIKNLETDLDNNYYEKGETDNAITNAISATRNEDNYWKGKTYFANEVTLSNSAANSPQLWLCAANCSKTKLEQKSDNFDLKSWLVSTNNAQKFSAIGPDGEHGEIELYPQNVRVTVPLNMEGNKISGLPISPFATNESDAVCVGFLDEKLNDFGGNVDDRLDDIEIDVLWCQTNIVSLWSNVNEFTQLQLISGDMSITQYMATTLYVQGKIDELNYDLSADIDDLQDQVDDIEDDVSDLEDELDEKLGLSGGIMEGDIDMDGSDIDDVGVLTVQELEFQGDGILNFTPGLGGEGVIQVDDDDVLLMTADNVTIAANLDINDNRIINLDDMQDEDTESTDAASVGYVREFVAEYTGDKDWFTHRRNHILAGGGKIDWVCHDVDDYSLKWSEDLIIIPAGANGTVFKILAENESPIDGIEPNTLFYVQPDDDEYQDGEIVELMVDADILSDYEPDPNDIIIGYAHSNGFFYLRDGRIIAANESNENGFDSRATEKVEFDNQINQIKDEIDENSGNIINIKTDFSKHITDFSNSVDELSQLVSNSEYYVSKTTTDQQAMAGGLTLAGKVIADDFYITGKPDLIMGNSGNPGTIYLFGEGMIEAPAAGGGNITLKAPNGSVKILNPAVCDDSLTVKKEIVLEDDLQLPKLAGSVIIDLPKTADKIDEYQIKNSLVKVSSVIIVTPLEEYEKIWVDRKVQGSFYINWRPKTREISFNYLIVNTEGK